MGYKQIFVSLKLIEGQKQIK